jgi:hypothetical protein
MNISRRAILGISLGGLASMTTPYTANADDPIIPGGLGLVKDYNEKALVGVRTAFESG